MSTWWKLAMAVACLALAGSASAGTLPGDVDPFATAEHALADESGPSPEERSRVEATAREAADTAAPGRLDMPAIGTPDMQVGDGWPSFAVKTLAGAGLAGLGGLALYGGARFTTPAEVLRSPVRQRLYNHLKRHLGATLKEVTDALELTTTNAIWHLRKLEDAGLVRSKRFNGNKLFYPAEGGIDAKRMSMGKTALANDNAQEVFAQVVASPGTHQREIARTLGVNHGTVRWHLKKLLDAELITEERRGKASAYAPTEAGLTALRHVVAASSGPSAPIVAA